MSHDFCHRCSAAPTSPPGSRRQLAEPRGPDPFQNSPTASHSRELPPAWPSLRGTSSPPGKFGIEPTIVLRVFLKPRPARPRCLFATGTAVLGFPPVPRVGVRCKSDSETARDLSQASARNAALPRLPRPLLRRVIFPSALP